MLYYSGFTRRIGDVDDGSTVTDFLPAERARGITIQSAAVTFHWPPLASAVDSAPPTAAQKSCTINLIDTPGHADFTFEVIRSLRVLDGAICILDGVAGVEAQTEKVWSQASGYKIPRLVFVNKLDREGAAFYRSVKEIASRLHTWPVLCQIPWWKEGKLVGVGDVVNFTAISWESSIDGSSPKIFNVSSLHDLDHSFAAELHAARSALVELLTEHDEGLVEAFLEAKEDLASLSGEALWGSLRRVILSGEQRVTPVFAGASFRNIGVQPLLDAVNILLPSPSETRDPTVSLGQKHFSLREFLQVGPGLIDMDTGDDKIVGMKKTNNNHELSACALAFKVVNDTRRGMMVYVRVYAGSLTRNTLLYNTSLGTAERAQRMVRMLANDAVEIDGIEEGQIGVIVGLKHARTGDTLIAYPRINAKSGPPSPINTLQLQPITVPPPLFFTSIEPHSLSEEKALEEALSVLLREDPSLSITHDDETGQTQLAGMGELHLEIARDKLINDHKIRASMGKIEIGYREAIEEASGDVTQSYDREISGKQSSASCTVSIQPLKDEVEMQPLNNHTQRFHLADDNVLTVEHPSFDKKGRSISSEGGSSSLHGLSLRSIIAALRAGAVAALARGPANGFPVHSTHVVIYFDPSRHITPTTYPSTLTSACRLAVTTALQVAGKKQPAVLMEPVMLATIAVNESSIGDVVHDLNAARGAHVLSLDATAESDSEAYVQTRADLEDQRLTPAQIDKVYAPRDPFDGPATGSATHGGSESMQMRQIKARVPLKEMVGYLKHLRSLTGGRGSFVMNVDTFEKMNTQRARNALNEMSGH